MTGETNDDRVVEFGDPSQTTLTPEQGEPAPAPKERIEQTPSTPGVTAAGADQRQAMTLAEIETIAIAARAAWHSAEEIHQITRDENRNFYANFKKIATHHADRLKQLEAHFEETEQKMNDLILEATRLMAEHQESVAQFNRTTRRLALSGFVMILVLLVVMEITWWVS